MSLNLAHGSLDGDEAVFIDALCKIRDAAKANDLPIMGFGISPSGVETRKKMGWNAFIIHGDIDAICTSASQCLKEYTGSPAADGANGAEVNGAEPEEAKANGAEAMELGPTGVDDAQQNNGESISRQANITAVQL